MNKTTPSHPPKVVEIRFHLHIAEHDLETKAHKIETALQKNHPVRIRLQLMGREKSRPQSGVDWLNNLAKRFETISKLNKQPTTDNLSVVLFPTKTNKTNTNRETKVE